MWRRRGKRKVIEKKAKMKSRKEGERKKKHN